jgi:DNA-binding SARP family transcriptional activator
MPGIVLNLLGPPSVALPHGSSARGLRASKCLALLAFLALEPGPHSREELATLLWGDTPEPAARASLRQALKQLREALGDAVRIDRDRVELTADVGCDVRDFLAAAARSPADAVPFDVPRFMAGFALRRAPAFEEWVETTRTSLRGRYTQALAATARDALASSRWRAATETARRWLECEPLSDDAAHLLAQAEYMAGDRARALRELREHLSRVRRETGAAASPSLQALLGRLENGDHAISRQDPDDDGEVTPSFHAALIGRERHWRVLVQAWRATTAGVGRVVLLEGEVGTGKTRLAEEFLQFVRAEGGTALRGRGYDAQVGIPYGPVVEALRDALDAPGLSGTAPEWLTEVTRLLPELRRRFPGLTEPPAPTDGAERWRLFEAVAQVLLALAAEQPTVLLVDDLQWCDGETCALLHFLARRLESAAIAILATVRLGDTERDAPAARLCRSLRSRSGATTVEIASLSQEQVWQLVRDLGRVRSPQGAQRFARRVHEVTDGNPFHVIELLKTLFTQGVLRRDEATGEWTSTQGGNGTGGLPMPPTVRDAIAERVAHLPEAHRELLATVAVTGAGCRTATLSHAHGISRLRAAALCDALVERMLLLERGGVYLCAHPVIAEVVREGLTASRRRETHRAIALALVAVSGPADVGEHSGEIARNADRGGERAMAYTYATRASEEAVKRYAFEEALSWLDLAARAAEPGEQADAVNRRTADVLGLAGWTESPRPLRRPGTPAAGIAQIDLDLG